MGLRLPQLKHFLQNTQTMEENGKRLAMLSSSVVLPVFCAQFWCRSNVAG